MKKQNKIRKLKKFVYLFPDPIAEAIFKSYRTMYEVKSRIWWNLYVGFFRTRENLEWIKSIRQGSVSMQNTLRFMSKQFDNKKPENDRYDIIVRYLAIEQHHNQNRIGYPLYEKMQYKRDRKKIPKERIISLTKEIKEKGFDPNKPLLVNRLQGLVDGSHRCACALYFDKKEIPLKVHGFNEDVVYGLNWFEEKGFTPEEVKLIKDRRNEIFVEKGIFFPVILWPPIKEFFGDIEKDISRKYGVVNTKEYHFKTNFDKFVKEIYAIDDIPLWQIKTKIKAMEKYPKYVRIAYINVKDPKYRKKENKKDVSMVLENLKRKQRKKYSKKIGGYVHDIVMHIGDNYEHNRKITEILKKNSKFVGKK